MTGARPGFRPPQMAREIKQWYRTRAELDKIYHIRGEKNHYISIATVARARSLEGWGGKPSRTEEEKHVFVALSVTLFLSVIFGFLNAVRDCWEGGGEGGGWGCETLEPAPSPKKKKKKH